MLSKESLEFLGRLKQAAQRKKKKVVGDQDEVTSDTSMSSMQSAASTAPTDRGALLASAMSSPSTVASSVARAAGRQALLERLKIKKATEGGTESIISATKPSIGRSVMVSYSFLNCFVAMGEYKNSLFLDAGASLVLSF